MPNFCVNPEILYVPSVFSFKDQVQLDHYIYGISKFVVILVMSYEVSKDNYVMSIITL